MKTRRRLVTTVLAMTLISGYGISPLAMGGQACTGSSPYVCAKRTGAVVPGTHVNFDLTDSDNPDVELVTGATDWEVWSQVSDTDATPANLGDLTLDPSVDTDDFQVKIANGAAAGAVNVLSINLDGTITNEDWEGYSAIASGSKISGDLGGNLVVVQDGSDAGGTANFTIEGDFTGNVTMFNAAGLTIEDQFGDGGTAYTMNVMDIDGGDLVIGTTVNTTVNIDGKPRTAAACGSKTAPADRS